MPVVCRRLEYRTALYISVFKLIKSYTPLYCTSEYVATHFIIFFIRKIYKNKVFAYKCNVSIYTETAQH